MATLTTFVFFSSCEKKEIIEPQACIITSNTFINLGDSVVFTNCSVADNVLIFFTTPGDEETYSGVSYTFDTNNSYTHVFSQTGIYTATLQASNNLIGSRIMLKKETITVN
tara:strand:- start:822 stop:1154 length:333 start_codon:yes stop_codon:yes gene_type:complete